MSTQFLEECTSVLARTPAALGGLLRGLPDAWTSATGGPGHWSPYTVVGHLIHGERTDWLTRIKIVLQHGEHRPFDPFDREAQFHESQGKSLPTLLDEFAALRHANLADLRALNLQPAQLDLRGTHPTLGPVTARQLLAAWTAHDLAHIAQITRTMARRYKEEAGPFSGFLSVMK